MKGIVSDKKANGKADFYKKNILVIQENLKLFTVCFAAFSLIMIVLNIANACTGGVALWLVVLLNVLWLIAAALFTEYALVGSAKRKRYFEKISQIVYGGLPGEYTVLVAEDCGEMIPKGERVRLYEEDARYVVICDGLCDHGAQFWTKYNFKRDFGRVTVEKACVQKEESEDKLVFGHEKIKICFRRKDQ